MAHTRHVRGGQRAPKILQTTKSFHETSVARRQATARRGGSGRGRGRAGVTVLMIRADVESQGCRLYEQSSAEGAAVRRAVYIS